MAPTYHQLGTDHAVQILKLVILGVGFIPVVGEEPESSLELVVVICQLAEVSFMMPILTPWKSNNHDRLTAESCRQLRDADLFGLVLCPAANGYRYGVSEFGCRIIRPEG
jgi:hypothetical protein